MKEEGLKIENGGYTFTQTAKIYLDDEKYQRRSITTVRGYKQLLNNWILKEIGDIKLRNITEQDLEKLYDKMRKAVRQRDGQPLSETYVCHCHKLITSIFNYAKKKKWVLTNPAEFVVNPPKLKIQKRDYYSLEEMLEVFELLENCSLRFKTAIFTLFNTGFRRGELFGLKWSDITRRKMPLVQNGTTKFYTTCIINVERELIVVTKELLESPDFMRKYNVIEIVDDTLVAVRPKTDKSVRKAIVVNEVYDTLMKYKQQQIDNGFNPTENDYVFRGEENLNRVWHPDNLTILWRKFIDKNNLKRITIHDIRHSHATYLLSIGIPPQDVARRLGHSEPSTTLRIYTHSNLVQDQKIVNMMADSIYNQSNIVDNGVNPLTLLSIITNDSKLSNSEDIFNALDFLTQKQVTNDELDSSMELCKKYILDNNPKLKQFNDAIETLSPELRKTLIGGITAIFDNNNELKLDPIINLTEYNKENISI